MTKKQHYMTEAERWQLEAMRRNKIPVAEIARQLGCSRQTIYNELKRGNYQHTYGDYYKVRTVYSADKGQAIRESRSRNKGRSLKIRSDKDFAEFLERKILYEKYSPAAALAAARRSGYQTTVCVTTLYTYISRRVFRKLRDIDLPEKVSRRRKKPEKESRIVHKGYPSIEQRPQHINERSEAGHWEMDLIVSGKKGSAALLTLTERQSREEIIRKINDKKAATVRAAIDDLERNTPNFAVKFKSITTDNGVEFMQYQLLQTSIYGGKRFDLYYCHSYSAWEKGTNENHNRMIRRWFPKGTNFDRISPERIQRVQDWMNDYPRKKLNWKSPREATA